MPLITDGKVLREVSAVVDTAVIGTRVAIYAQCKALPTGVPYRKEGTMTNDMPPPIEGDGSFTERRFWLRRVSVRRRSERPGADRRQTERRRPGRPAWTSNRSL